MNETDFQIRHTLQPGDLGAIVQLHGIVYANEYGLDTTFEPYVAKPLSDFVLEGSGRLWVAERDGRLMGSIAVVVSEGEGQLRWFLLAPEARGSGLGRRLLDLAMHYCQERRFPRVFLWSFTDLTAALKLYERAGFKVTETVTEYVWGAQRAQVRMDLELSQG